jgi:predicted permease
VLLYARVTQLSRPVLAALMLCVPLGNTSFLGFAMVEALLGASAVQYAVVYDQLGSFLVLSTYGITMVALFSGEGRPTVRAIALRIAKFPPFIALCVALMVPPSELLTGLVSRLGDTLVPLAMFAVGLRLQLKPSALTHGRELVFGLAVKMGLLPLAMTGVLHLLGAEGDPARVARLESAMPPMITAGALASMAGFAPELAAALVGYGILLGLLTLPLWAG